MNKKITTPVLFLIFNRPDTTELVFNAIRKAKPSKLYIAADGPRLDKIGETEKCESVHKIVSQIDWDCEVKTLFRKNNLGCKTAVSQAIKWFFDNEEMGIILEDDCLPNSSFFPFCQELLEKYKDNDQIFMISGDNFNREKIGEADYYFSRIPNIWGWATWKRAWQKYDISMSFFDDFKKENKIENIWSRKNVQNYWLEIFERTKRSEIDAWDYQLAFCIFSNEGFCISPNQNLVSNIGFFEGGGFTNTLIKDKRVSSLPRPELQFPIKHPNDISYSEENDLYKNKINLKNYLIKKTLRQFGLFNLSRKIIVIWNVIFAKMKN